MELQDGKMERKRFIIYYLSFYSSDVSVYYSLKFIFVIVWAAKIHNLFSFSKNIFNLLVCNRSQLSFKFGACLMD